MSPQAIEQAYKDFLNQNQLALQGCDTCGYIRPPTSWICPECWSEKWQWKMSLGVGQVETFTWFDQSMDDRFVKVPYSIAVVHLDEGVRIIGNINHAERSNLKIGLRVVTDIGLGYQGKVTLRFKPFVTSQF
ncbi:MAG: OB-fold domain-containing protein [Betaproteobacteria bacterium]|jgi:uncharacterized OB-fold protein|nr:hypothetical protein [Betaproteobacteria bacterium]NBT68535.1 hypothetical protein [Betaproteobacteria bacterium]NBY08228.1 hypothetical protein [Betaproteobacteria bacterium]